MILGNSLDTWSLAAASDSYIITKRSLYRSGSASMNSTTVEAPVRSRNPSIRGCEPSLAGGVPSDPIPAKRENSSKRPDGSDSEALPLKVNSCNMSSSSNTVRGTVLSSLPSRCNRRSRYSSSKMPGGSPVSELSERSSVSRRTRPSKSPACRREML